MFYESEYNYDRTKWDRYDLRDISKL
jgi:hypothetical protein